MIIDQRAPMLLVLERIVALLGAGFLRPFECGLALLHSLIHLGFDGGFELRVQLTPEFFEQSLDVLGLRLGEFPLRIQRERLAFDDAFKASPLYSLGSADSAVRKSSRLTNLVAINWLTIFNCSANTRAYLNGGFRVWFFTVR